MGRTRRRAGAVSGGRRRGKRPGLSTRVGSLTLPNPVMTASGTSGHGAELGAFFDLSLLGAVVVKSLAAWPWPGNPAPRVHETSSGMLNSVGLQGAGLAAWLEEELPALAAAGVRVVVSVWGRSVADYERTARLLAEVSTAVVVAVEVNVSCPNVEDRQRMFAHSPTATEEVLAATEGCGRPRWAKLSPNVTDLVEIAAAAQRGGAEAVTLVNTLMAMAIDVETRRYRLGADGGGMSGAAVHPVAVRAVHDVHRALPELAIVGVGGVSSGNDAAELLLAGASAVQVGTATFADPRAPLRVLTELQGWAARHGVTSVGDVVGAVHQRVGVEETEEREMGR